MTYLNEMIFEMAFNKLYIAESQAKRRTSIVIECVIAFIFQR